MFEIFTTYLQTLSQGPSISWGILSLVAHYGLVELLFDEGHGEARLAATAYRATLSTRLSPRGSSKRGR